MNILQLYKLTSIILLLIFLSGCKKASVEVIENIGKTITKESIGITAEAGTKSALKSFTKKEIEHTLIENGLNTNVINNVFKHLSNDEIRLLINESSIFKSIFINFNSRPDLVLAYKKLINNENARTNISYLFQTENWIKKGSKGDLVLEVPNNINKKFLGQEVEGVKFVKKIIKFEGLNFTIVVPDFNKFKVFSAPPLESVFLKSSDKIQFEISKLKLRKEYLNNPKKIEELLMVQNKRFAENGGVFFEGRNIIDPLEMLEIQKKDILQDNLGKQQGRIFGFVWHHNENVGVIDLVAYDIHEKVKHIGGKSIWGGGFLARK